MEDKKIRTSLQRTYINYVEWARANNINSVIYQLNSELWGFVYRSRFEEYLIVINSILSFEMQKEVFCHEVEHILYDMPKEGYIIGLDMQYSPMEKQTNKRAQMVAENMSLHFFD